MLQTLELRITNPEPAENSHATRETARECIPGSEGRMEPQPPGQLQREAVLLAAGVEYLLEQKYIGFEDAVGSPQISHDCFQARLFGHVQSDYGPGVTGLWRHGRARPFLDNDGKLRARFGSNQSGTGQKKKCRAPRNEMTGSHARIFLAAGAATTSGKLNFALL
jgi:hypothetical protein